MSGPPISMGTSNATAAYRSRFAGVGPTTAIFVRPPDPQLLAALRNSDGVKWGRLVWPLVGRGDRDQSLQKPVAVSRRRSQLPIGDRDPMAHQTLGGRVHLEHQAHIAQQDCGAVDMIETRHDSGGRGGGHGQRKAAGPLDVRHNRGNLFNLRPRKRFELGGALDRQDHWRYLIKVDGAEGAEPPQPEPAEELALERVSIQFLRCEEIAFRYDFLKPYAPRTRTHFARVADMPAFAEERFANLLQTARDRVKRRAFRSMIEHLRA